MRSNSEHVIDVLRTQQTIGHRTDNVPRRLPPPAPPAGTRSRPLQRPATTTYSMSPCAATSFGHESDSSDRPGTDIGRSARSADNGLTERQRTILDVIRASVTSRGYPPSIREIGDAVGLTSTSSVAHQLRTLERKGYLRRDPNRPRAVDVRGADDIARPTVLPELSGAPTMPEPPLDPTAG